MNRLTDILRAFVATLVALGASVAHAAADAIEAGFLEPTPKQAAFERTLKGQTFTIQPVDRSAIEMNLGRVLSPHGYLADVREVGKALQEEVNKRGPGWADTCLRGALVEHLVKPLRATAGDAPEKPAKGKKAA